MNTIRVGMFVSRRMAKLFGLVAIGVALVLVAIIAIPRMNTGKKTTESNAGRFVVESYVSILGMAPSFSEWQQAKADLTADGCNRDSLSNVLAGLLVQRADSSILSEKDMEFASRILNQPLADTKPNAQLVSKYTADRICSGQYRTPSNTPAVDMAKSIRLGVEKLQAELLALSPGSIYYLDPEVIIEVGTQTLAIPPGVTLATRDYPTSDKYRNMARLVLNGKDRSSTILVAEGASLASMHVYAGECIEPNDKCQNAAVIVLKNNTEIRDCRIENASMKLIRNENANFKGTRILRNLLLNHGAEPVADFSDMVMPEMVGVYANSNTVLKGDGPNVMMLPKIFLDKQKASGPSNTFILLVGSSGGGKARKV